MDVMTRDQLDLFRCRRADCRCGRVTVRALCHPNAELEVFYMTGTGILCVVCKDCRELVTQVAVAASTDRSWRCRVN